LVTVSAELFSGFRADSKLVRVASQWHEEFRGLHGFPEVPSVNGIE
jgi:hypothetical protein